MFSLFFKVLLNYLEHAKESLTWRGGVLRNLLKLSFLSRVIGMDKVAPSCSDSVAGSRLVYIQSTIQMQHKKHGGNF